MREWTTLVTGLVLIFAATALLVLSTGPEKHPLVRRMASGAPATGRWLPPLLLAFGLLLFLLGTICLFAVAASRPATTVMY